MRAKTNALLDRRDRTVVPRWRLFNSTLKADGQLSSSRVTNAKKSECHEARDGAYAHGISEFRKNKTVWFAGDVLSEALVRNDQNIIDEVSACILAPDSGATATLLEMAKKGQPFSKELAGTLPERVSALRSRLWLYPRTAPGWVDLAYYLTLSGKISAAERAMRVALQLAPFNRFVLRSASRFYIHIGESERAHALLLKSDATLSDPWLVAGEIASATAANRTPRLIRRGREMVGDLNFDRLHVSELASAIGTVLMGAGSSPRREMKTMFRTSLDTPTENSLAQAEWASRRTSAVPLPDFENRADVAEAQAWHHYVCGDYTQTLKFARQWRADQPFSARPVHLIAWIEASLSERYDSAIAVLTEAERPNPNDRRILNNLAFAYASREGPGDLLHAHRYNDRARKLSEADQDFVFVFATGGLIAYRENAPERGRQLYLKAIELASRPGVDERLAPMAWMYLAREESRAGGLFASTAISKARAEATRSREKDVEALWQRLEKILSVGTRNEQLSTLAVHL
jgi:tetratricopeptide (TPR) repeat protein